MWKEDALQGNHLVDDASQRPDVALAVVARLRKELGAHVVRRADVRVCERGCAERLGQAKVAELDVLAGVVEEHCVLSRN